MLSIGVGDLLKMLRVSLSMINGEQRRIEDKFKDALWKHPFCISSLFIPPGFTLNLKIEYYKFITSS